MDDETLDERFDGALATLREERRRCPEADRLFDYAQGGLAGAERVALERHAAACVSCADLVSGARAEPHPADDLTWARARERLDARKKPWLATDRAAFRRRPGSAWRWTIAAAVSVAAAGLGWHLLRPAPAGPISEVRGSAIQGLVPTGEMDLSDLGAFQWASTVPADVTYRVEVAREGRIVWRDTTEDTRLMPPPELLALLVEAGSVRWRVVGLARSGAIVLESAWAPLDVRASPPTLPRGERPETGRDKKRGAGH